MLLDQAEKAEIQPYWDAVVRALKKIDQNPTRCLHKLQQFYQELQKTNLSRNRPNTVSLVTDLSESFPAISIGAGEKLAAIANALPDATEFEFRRFLSYFCQHCFESPLQPTSEPIKNHKVAEKFLRQEKRYQVIISNENKNPFKLGIKASRSEKPRQWLTKIFSAYDKTAGLPIERLADYIIQHPDSAKHFLKQRAFGYRNFRKEFCKNPELIYKLFHSKNPHILTAIADTKLLASRHLSLPDRKKFNEMQNKLPAANLADIDRLMSDLAVTKTKPGTNREHLMLEMQEMKSQGQQNQQNKIDALQALDSLNPGHYKQLMTDKLKGLQGHVYPSGQQMQAFVTEINKAMASPEGLTGKKHWELIEKHKINFGQAFSENKINELNPKKHNNVAAAAAPELSPASATLPKNLQQEKSALRSFAKLFH